MFADQSFITGKEHVLTFSRSGFPTACLKGILTCVLTGLSRAAAATGLCLGTSGFHSLLTADDALRPIRLENRQEINHRYRFYIGHKYYVRLES